METDPQHTPGPWTAWDDDGTGTLPCVLSKQPTRFGNFYVAQCNNFEDARFIATAPGLYLALQAAMRYADFGGCRDVEQMVSDALDAAVPK